MTTTEIKDGLLSGYLRKERLRRIAQYVNSNQILDIGCDQGFLIPYLSRDINYYGVDANPSMLEKARSQYPQHTFQQLMLTKESIVELPDKQFDTIVMAAIIEHLDEPVEVLKRFREKLTPNGRIVMTSPHEKSHRLLVWMARLGLARNDKHEHEHYIDHTMVEPLLEQNLFNLVCYKRFQFGLNQLWVLEKSDQ